MKLPQRKDWLAVNYIIPFLSTDGTVYNIFMSKERISFHRKYLMFEGNLASPGRYAV
jgi:hypothetical protein